jgi:2-oxoisovalerate dehydrogenase E1 component
MASSSAGLKAEGDEVRLGETVAEIETDKALVEIDAPAAGWLGPFEAEAGAEVPMGGRIGSVRP